MKTYRCLECEADIKADHNLANHEVVSCSCCGAEYEVKKQSKGRIILVPLNLEGEDWGE